MSALQVLCQHVNFLSVVVMTWVTTTFRSRYQIVHACNVMFSAVNFLPGQVGLLSAGGQFHLYGCRYSVSKAGHEAPNCSSQFMCI